MTRLASLVAILVLLPAGLQAQSGWSLGPHFGISIPQGEIRYFDFVPSRAPEHSGLTLGGDVTYWLRPRVGLTGQLGTVRSKLYGPLLTGPGSDYHVTYLTVGSTIVVVHGTSDLELGVGVGAADETGEGVAGLRHRAAFAWVLSAEARIYLGDRVALKGGLGLLAYQLRLENPDGTSFSSSQEHDLLVRAGVAFDLFPRRDEE